MSKLVSIINPDEDLLIKLALEKHTDNLKFTYISSKNPHPSSELILSSYSNFFNIRILPEFSYIPFLIYGDVKNLYNAFILGASDYLKNPWTFNEFEIRAHKYIKNDEINFKWGKIYFSNELMKTSFNKILISVKEYKILSLLVKNQGNIISREIIHHRLGITNVKSRIVDVYINSIRKKIKLLFPIKILKEEVIITIRGEGYIIY